MSNSPLVQYVRWSPNHSGKRTQPIRKITIHHVAGVVSVETLGNIFAPTTRQASSTYGIGMDGRIAQFVDEGNRPWTSGSNWNDQQAVTIEVSNSAVGGVWPVSDHNIQRTIELCVDIIKRNPTFPEITYTGTKDGVFTLHEMFQNTSCPGPYLKSKIPYIVSEVKKRLGTTKASGGGEMTWDEKVRKSMTDAKIMSDADWDKPVTKDQIASWLFTARAKGYFADHVAESNPVQAPKPTLKSVSIIAKEVIDGLWGNGQDRINRLTAAGYDATAVQNEVNRILRGK